MPVKARLFQAFADALIPLLGFYLWDWNLYFIFLFFIADEVVESFFMLLKTNKIVSIQKPPIRARMTNVAFGFILLSGEIFLLHALVFNLTPSIQFRDEIISFLSYSDLGIQQGYILLPLLLLLGYQRFKLEFIVPEVYRKTTLTYLWAAYRKKQFFVWASVSIGIGISAILSLSDQWYLWYFIVCLALYDFLDKSQR